MKKLLFTLMAAMFVFSTYAKDIKELVVTTNPPMSCQNCENKIKGNLRFEKGIKKIETNIPEQRVIIEYDAEKTNPELIENAFEKIGYKVEVINPDDESAQSSTCTNSSGSCSNETANSQENKECCKKHNNC